jgi:F-type H+-transporting ATPase subunit gamma
MLPWLVPHLQTEPGIVARLRERVSLPRILPGGRGREGKTALPRHRLKTLVIGSERGLCGRFNVAVAEETERYLRRESSGGATIDLLVLGSRVQRVLRRRGHEPTEVGTLSMTALPSLSMAFELARKWLKAYEERELDRVDVIYNGYRGTGTYEPTVMQLIPPELPTGEETTTSARRGRPWPPPIIDTDPESLYATVVEQSAAVQLYRVLLDSSAAEHSTRFQLMESATQNADRLIEELTLVIQTARHHEITQEMQELATGAGLVGRE